MKKACNNFQHLYPDITKKIFENMQQNMQAVSWILLFTWAFWWWVDIEWTEQAYLNHDDHFWKTRNLHFQEINMISRSYLGKISNHCYDFI